MDAEGAQLISQPHSLCRDPFQHPGGSAADAPVPLARQQEGEQAMRGVVAVTVSVVLSTLMMKLFNCNQTLLHTVTPRPETTYGPRVKLCGLV